MKFDKWTFSECLRFMGCKVKSSDPGTPGSDGGNPNVDPPDDPPPDNPPPDIPAACSDPQYAELHPGECGSSPVTLMIRPSVVTKCAYESVQFKTFVRSNGQEMEVSECYTEGCPTYTSSDSNIVVVGSASGNATGVTAGIASITVNWKGYTASAQVTVMGAGRCCDDTHVDMFVVMDNSKSMSQPFDTEYSTKLEYAKAIANQIAQEVDYSKDRVGVVSFNEAGATMVGLGATETEVIDSIASISQSGNGTDISSGINFARDMFSTGNINVIFLITDGEDTSENDPVEAARAFLNSATPSILVVIGVRAHTIHFIRLEQIASGGFFVNALPSNASDCREWVSNIKGYFCAGNCIPTGGAEQPTPQLDYDAFRNWDVSGKVDLIGKGDEVAIFNLLPGHGLYVDLAGSGPPWIGGLTSKASLNLQVTSGVEYQLSYYLAGNQRKDETGYKVRVVVVGEGGTTYSDVLREIDDYKQPFTKYTDTFTPDASEAITVMIIQADHATAAYGNLLDDVLLTDENGTILLADNFDRENLKPVDGCGYGSYGCYGTGCADDPAPGQSPDPNPLSPIESNTPTVTTYTSTKCYTATCAAGLTGATVEKCATVTSIISQADADTKALAQATDEANAELECLDTFDVGDILNIDLCTPVDGLGLFTSPKVGKAATGIGDDDYWNNSYYSSNMRKHDGVAVGVALDWMPTGHGGTEVEFFLDHHDKMYQSGLLFYRDGGTVPQTQKFYLTGLPAGTYTVYVYAHGNTAGATGIVHVHTGMTDGGTKETINGTTFNQTAWAEDVQYVKYAGIDLAADSTFHIDLLPGADGSVVGNGIQIVRTA